VSAIAAAPLSGDAASLIIRALLDFRSLWTTHDLVTTTGVPAPTIRHVINRLERESLVARQAPGVIAVPSWLALLRRWTEDRPFNGNPHLTYWRSKNRAPHVLDRIPTTPVLHAVTGAHAARHWAPETPAGPTVIYTPDAHLAATAWDLVPARTRTVILVEPRHDLVYTRARKTPTGLRLAAPSQVLTDLLTGATKSPTTANPLATWMLEHELDWRY
jgi:hypothetical protein